MQQTRGTWVAWGSGNADYLVTDENNEVLVPQDNPSYMLKRIPLSEEEEQLYYRGFANRVLWPLFHLFIDKMHQVDEYWQAYYSVNKKFAKTVLEVAEDQDRIWIHDYHLALTPKFIREQLPHARISFFWHIPWPPWEVFGVLPQKHLMREGLLNSDLIGFHTNSYVKNFLNCVRRHPETKVNDASSIVQLDNRQTKIASFPLGISYGDFAHPPEENILEKKAQEVKKMYNASYLILGMDRLDYTKGILNRLKAFECFIQNYPEFQRKVVLIQIATPSRYEIEEYHNMRKEIEETVGCINGKYRTEKWTPIMYFYRRIPQQLLLTYYKAADIGLLTPIRDGMNLIAKEFIASSNENTVLLLSEFAGAAEELNEALIVNPYDIQGTADAIHHAITMNPKEKKQRFNQLKQKVQHHDSSWWLKQFMNQWDQCYATATQ